MALYDEKHTEFLSILEAQRFTEKTLWEESFREWLDKKIESINVNNRNISGNLLQPYLAAMRYSSKEAMDIIMSIGFNPTYQILQKRQSILSVYLTSSDNLNSEMLNYHLSQVSGFYGDIPEKQRVRKLFDYVNQVDPFLGQDALINVATRKTSHTDSSSKISEKHIIECSKVLLTHGADLTRSDRNNYSALHWAIIEGNSRVAIHLIRNIGIDGCIAYNNSGETPLALSAKNGYRDVVLALLKKGVSPSGYTTKLDAVDIPETMISKLMVNNPLLLSLRSGHVGISNDLVLCGGTYLSSINAHDMHTGLIYAAKLNAPELLENMLRHGFSPNESNSHGFTALLYLVSNMSSAAPDTSSNYQRMVSELIKSGSSIEVMSKNGLAVLDILEGMAKKGDDFSMQIIFNRNVAKLTEFVNATSGVEVHKISDLHVTDEQLADMRTTRVENVSSVWLNRAMKTEEYKESILKSGKSGFKDVVYSPFIGGSAVYGILKGVGEYAEKKTDLPYHEIITMAVNNIGSITAVCAVLAAGFVAYSTLTDDSKKYALGYWLKNTSSGLVEKYLDPVLKSMDSITDEKILRLRTVLFRYKARIDGIISRIGSAYAVLTGKLDIETNAPVVQEVQELTSQGKVVKMPSARVEEDRSQIGMR
jgi:ankyrin repeat protein